MPISPFVAAINQICTEKSLPKEVILGTVEAALAAAYRKDYGTPNQHIRAHFDEKTNTVSFEDVKVVKEEEKIENKEAEVTVEQAKKMGKKKPKIGDEIVTPLPSHSEFGRIAAQTAKQVIIQRIREAEKEMLFREFKEKEHQIVAGYVQNIEGKNVIVNIGKINAIMFPSEQSPNEHYFAGQRLRVFVKEVVESGRGPQVVVSRSDPRLISGLFALEVPEIENGVEINSVSREAGSRTKIAVSSNQEGLDPVGSCVGQRGTRVQAVLNEIGDEKIDIVLFDKDIKKFITNALSPARVEAVELEENSNQAKVTVDPDQLSLAIGKGGQNVRLASKLTNWNIDIIRSDEKESKEE